MEINISLKFVEELNQIDWFANCGKREGDSDASVLPADQVDYIMKKNSAIKWENAVLEYAGDVTAALCLNHRDEYNQWNRLVQEIKAKHLSSLRKKWRRALKGIGLDQPPLVQDIAFNVLHLIMIYSYKEALDIEIPVFWEELLNVYKSGHLPFGNSGKEREVKFLIL